MTLILIRHPQTVLPAGICYGRMDVPLVGWKSACAFHLALRQDGGRRFAFPPYECWSSPAVRCTDVARAIGSAYGIEVHTDPRLLELDFGDWEGVAWSDVPRAELDCWAGDVVGFAPPNGESGASLIERVTAFHAGLRGCNIVVSHGGPLRVLAALAEGRPVDLSVPAPALGSVQVFPSGRGGDAEDDALREHFRGAQDIAGVAADLPPGGVSEKRCARDDADDAEGCGPQQGR